MFSVCRSQSKLGSRDVEQWLLLFVPSCDWVYVLVLICRHHLNVIVAFAPSVLSVAPSEAEFQIREHIKTTETKTPESQQSVIGRGRRRAWYISTSTAFTL